MNTTRTDLAMEAFEDADGISGAEINRWETEGVSVTEVIIETEDAASRLGKPIGSYLTLEAPRLREHNPDVRLALANLLGEEIGRLLADLGAQSDVQRKSPILIVGLGNRMITPDSLGSAVAERIFVTRHMLEQFGENVQSVCAVAPGVLGVTGIETVELVEGLARKIEPRAVLCVDSLAARSADHVGTSVQLTDTGIQPGSGVGNHRKPLTHASLGCPVLAVGVPTVIHAAALARDAISRLDGESHPDAYDAAEHTLMQSPLGDMIVTPREIDTLIDDAAQVLALGMNKALQPHLSDADMLRFL